MALVSPRARTVNSVPQPYTGTHSSEVKLLEDRLRDFQAENALLGRTLRDVQAERQAQQRALAASQAQCADMRQQLQASTSRCSQLQRQVEQLNVAAVKRDQHLEQSLVQRQELEALVLDMEEQLTDLNSNRQDQRPAPAGGAGREPAGSPTLSRRPGQQAKGTRGGVQQAGAQMSPPQARSPVVPAQQPDLRDEIARLEELYSAKLQLVRQQAEARVEEVQQRYNVAGAAAQAGAQEALAQLRGEVQRQVQEAEAGLQRQLQQQSRLVEQLQKRCIALEAHVKALKASAASRPTQPAVTTPPTQPQGAANSNNLKHELTSLRQQLLVAQDGRRQVTSTVDAAAVALGTFKQQAEENMRRLHHVRQELCSALEQQHQLTQDNMLMQSAAVASTTHLSAAEAAIKDLREMLCDAREKLLHAQATTVAEALHLAAQDVQQSGLDTVGKNAGPTGTYVRVLEHALRESDAREAALKRAVSESQFLEVQARRLLAASRDEQLAMRKTLVQQVHRVLAMEAVRLSDAREMCSAVSPTRRAGH